MDRARDPGAARSRSVGAHPRRRGGGALTGRSSWRVVVLALAAAAACKLSPDLARIIAIEIIAPDSLEEGDILKPQARYLSAYGPSGDSTARWYTPDTTITVDSLSGWTSVRIAGSTGRLLAQGHGLLSNPLTIRTLAAADTLFATGPTRDSVPASAGLSDSLHVEVGDIVRSSAGADSLTVPLPGRPVVYTVSHPVPPSSVTLVTSDTARTLSDTARVWTGPAGIAFVKVRLLAPTPPDSVVVSARAPRAQGDTVPVSVTFTVRFLP